jgi:hypothetical protein
LRVWRGWGVVYKRGQLKDGYPLEDGWERSERLGGKK